MALVQDHLTKCRCALTARPNEGSCHSERHSTQGNDQLENMPVPLANALREQRLEPPVSRLARTEAIIKQLVRILFINFHTPYRPKTR